VVRGHDVGLARDAITLAVAGKWRAALAGVSGYRAIGVDQRHLTAGRARIFGYQTLQSRLGIEAARQQVESPRPVGDLDVGLGRDRSDSSPGPGNDRADREPVGLDRDPQFAAGRVAGDDRVRALPPAIRREARQSVETDRLYLNRRAERWGRRTV
jgi:hypothetical protein